MRVQTHTQTHTHTHTHTQTLANAHTRKHTDTRTHSYQEIKTIFISSQESFWKKTVDAN